MRLNITADGALTNRDVPVLAGLIQLIANHSTQILNESNDEHVDMRRLGNILTNDIFEITGMNGDDLITFTTTTSEDEKPSFSSFLKFRTKGRSRSSVPIYTMDVFDSGRRVVSAENARIMTGYLARALMHRPLDVHRIVRTPMGGSTLLVAAAKRLRSNSTAPKAVDLLPKGTPIVSSLPSVYDFPPHQHDIFSPSSDASSQASVENASIIDQSSSQPGVPSRNNASRICETPSFASLAIAPDPVPAPRHTVTVLPSRGPNVPTLDCRAVGQGSHVSDAEEEHTESLAHHDSDRTVFDVSASRRMLRYILGQRRLEREADWFTKGSHDATENELTSSHPCRPEPAPAVSISTHDTEGSLFALMSAITTHKPWRLALGFARIDEVRNFAELFLYVWARTRALIFDDETAQEIRRSHQTGLIDWRDLQHLLPSNSVLAYDVRIATLPFQKQASILLGSFFNCELVGQMDDLVSCTSSPSSHYMLSGSAGKVVDSWLRTYAERFAPALQSELLLGTSMWDIESPLVSKDVSGAERTSGEQPSKRAKSSPSHEANNPSGSPLFSAHDEGLNASSKLAAPGSRGPPQSDENKGIRTTELSERVVPSAHRWIRLGNNVAANWLRYPYSRAIQSTAVMYPSSSNFNSNEAALERAAYAVETELRNHFPRADPSDPTQHPYFFPLHPRSVVAPIYRQGFIRLPRTFDALLQLTSLAPKACEICGRSVCAVFMQETQTSAATTSYIEKKLMHHALLWICLICGCFSCMQRSCVREHLANCEGNTGLWLVLPGNFLITCSKNRSQAFASIYNCNNGTDTRALTHIIGPARLRQDWIELYWKQLLGLDD